MLRGIVPPLITPLTGPDTLDVPGLERLLDHVVEGGVHGVFVLGTTGEGPSLSHRLQRQVVSRTRRIVGDRAKVLVGVSDTSCEESVALADHAADVGCDAVVVAPPYYFPAGQTELRQYIRRLVPRIELPTVLYNMPSLTKVTFDRDTLAELADLDRVTGVKDSGGDLSYYRDLLRLRAERRPDWSVLIGPEHLLPESMRSPDDGVPGGDGGVNGGANVFPKLFVRLFEAIEAGDHGRVESLQEQVGKLQAIYEIGKYASRFIKATKSAAEVRGLCRSDLAEPFNGFAAPERERVRSVLDSLDPALVS